MGDSPAPAAWATRLLPPEVAVAVMRGDVPVADAWPDELAVAEGLPAARRAEYVTVRHCARSALASLAIPPAAILDDDKGAPIWPDGVIGSLTHCRGYRAAAVARRDSLAALGIDAEPAEALPPGVLARISSEAERGRIAYLTSQDGDVPWDRLLFSAKESVYKAWHPLTRRPLGFHDVDVALRPDGQGSVVFLVAMPEAAARLDWHLVWAVDGAVITTAVCTTGDGSFGADPN